MPMKPTYQTSCSESLDSGCVVVDCWRLLPAAGGCWRLLAGVDGCRRLRVDISYSGGVRRVCRRRRRHPWLALLESRRQQQAAAAAEKPSIADVNKGNLWYG